MPSFECAFSQSSATVSSNQRSSSSSWPWNSIGMPGEVSTITEPSTARFFAHQLSAAPGRDRLRDADLAVRDVVVRLGVDHAAERRAAALPDDRGRDGAHVP